MGIVLLVSIRMPPFRKWAWSTPGAASLYRIWSSMAPRLGPRLGPVQWAVLYWVKHNCASISAMYGTMASTGAVPAQKLGSDVQVATQ